MGKGEDEQSAADGRVSVEASERNAGDPCPPCRSIGRIVGLRCVAALFLGCAVLLSAVFWLPPFLGADHKGRRRNPELEADIVASFILHKPVDFLKANVAKLEYDIFEEIGVPNSSVVLYSLESIPHLNWTNVVFGVWPYPKNSSIPSYGLSLLRSLFMDLADHASTLHVTTSLFGNSSFFQVRRFPDGFTVIPKQSAFPLQKMEMLFNFTLNFPIDRVLDKFVELKAQMKLGLLLNSYENLYVRLTNLKGSTIDPPTIVETSIVLAVGNRPPPMPRLKELAQTIRNSSGGNLGLNHTVFGRVKQIRLSSFLQRSLYSGANGDAPSPTPQFSPNHHHHHHHHHHHRHRSDVHMAPAPAPQYYHRAPPPGACRSRIWSKSNQAHLVPVAAPRAFHHHKPVDSVPSPAPVASRPQQFAPQPQDDSSAPTPHLFPSSPLPAVYFSRARPPSGSVTKPPNGMPSIAPSLFSSSSITVWPSMCRGIIPLLFFLMLL
ncbi:hypothetical protein DsansV1_C01g0006541 [Dioscorea sansibarensis]